jgi:hypothetical protein
VVTFLKINTTDNKTIDGQDKDFGDWQLWEQWTLLTLWGYTGDLRKLASIFYSAYKPVIMHLNSMAKCPLTINHNALSQIAT